MPELALASGSAHIPAELAATVMAEARHRQRAYHGLVTWEFRRVGSSERVGVKLLIGPAHVSVSESSLVP